MLGLRARAAAFGGRVHEFRELYRQSIQLKLRNNRDESAAFSTALQALIEADIGNLPEAREALEAVHFKQVQKDNTLEAVERFLEQHPDGLHAEEVRRTEDLLHWVNAQRAKSLAGYESFLQSYPDSRFSEEAKVKMAPFALAELMGSSDIKAYEDFLERFPDGPSTEIARKTLEGLRGVD